MHSVRVLLCRSLNLIAQAASSLTRVRENVVLPVRQAIVAAVADLLQSADPGVGGTLVHLVQAALNCTMFPELLEKGHPFLELDPHMRHAFKPVAQTVVALLRFDVQQPSATAASTVDQHLVNLWRQLAHLMAMWGPPLTFQPTHVVTHTLTKAASEPQPGDQELPEHTVLRVYMLWCLLAGKNSAAPSSVDAALSTFQEACTTGPVITCISRLAQTQPLAAGLGGEAVWGIIQRQKGYKSGQLVAAACMLALPLDKQPQTELCDLLYRRGIKYGGQASGSQEGVSGEDGVEAGRYAMILAALSAAAQALAWQLQQCLQGVFCEDGIPVAVECMRHLTGLSTSYTPKLVSPPAIDALFSCGALSNVFKVRCVAANFRTC